jgi:3-isopropylmalate/(R)-2-methylmalate dehydratase small subunit
MDDPVTSQVLVAPRNFGCGSSREQAVWALTDYGVRAVLALSYGDIFRNNCVKNDVVAAVMAPDDHAALVRWLDDGRGAQELTIDVRSCSASIEDGGRFPLQLADGHAERLLSAEDHIARTLRYEALIVAHEQKVRSASPWLSSID